MTVLMSLDATAVLFTPVVIGVVHAAPRRVGTVATRDHAARERGLQPPADLEPHQPARVLCDRPVVRRLRGAHGAADCGPAAVVVGTVVVDTPRGAPSPLERAPSTVFDRFAVLVLVAIGVLTGAFFASALIGVAPTWIAMDGAAVLAVVAIGAAACGPSALARATSPTFLVFVLGLAVVVQAAVDHGLHDLALDVLPSGEGLLPLLAMAGLAAVLANLVNNLPATLVLVSVVPAGSTALLLALLVGVNIGPNLTYTGSLATLLWRRVVRREGVEPVAARILPARRAHHARRARRRHRRPLAHAPRPQVTKTVS